MRQQRPPAASAFNSPPRWAPSSSPTLRSSALNGLLALRDWLTIHLLHRVPPRALALFALLLCLSTAAVNLVVLPRVNRGLPGKAGALAGEVLGRQVTIGPIQWISPLGLIGITPLAVVGPVAVGPGGVELSSAEVARVAVGVDVGRSLMEWGLVLKVDMAGALVNLVQSGNFSWFGYPDDAIPSARNFFPGLEEGMATLGRGAKLGTGSKENNPEPESQCGTGC